MFRCEAPACVPVQVLLNQEVWLLFKVEHSDGEPRQGMLSYSGLLTEAGIHRRVYLLLPAKGSLLCVLKWLAPVAFVSPGTQDLQLY